MAGSSPVLFIVMAVVVFILVWRDEPSGTGSGRNSNNDVEPTTPIKEIPADKSKTEPDSETKTVPETSDDRDVGIDRTPYSERLERPEFDFDNTEPRVPTGGTDEPASIDKLPDLDELPDPDDLYRDK